MARFDDVEAARFLPLFGAFMVLLAWLGLWWDVGALRERLFSAMRWASDEPRIGSALALALLGVGIAGVVFSLAFLLRRQMRLTAALKARDAELVDVRDRLRRHVADLERIADVAAHDLQEPLRRMVAYAQLLETHERCHGDGEISLYVSHVVDGARRMKALVSGLRAFVSMDSVARPEARTAAVEAVMVARKRLADQLAAVDAALIVDPLPEVLADQASLVEIFLQLLDNAVRFRAEDRRPVVHVSARCEDGMVRFQIRDNGIGIDPARVARMFEIFYRPHDAGMASSLGIGMGLAVVRRLVERLGGEVWVESQFGSGSCFGFSLPLDRQSAPWSADQEVEAT